jgi:hypothetical protein
MVGVKNAEFAQEGYSVRYAPSVVQKVWSTANQIGYSGYFPFREGEYVKGGYVTDDHYYINTIPNIPCIDIIQFDATNNRVSEAIIIPMPTI